MDNVCKDCVKAIKLSKKTCCYEINSKHYLQTIESLSVQECIFFKSKSKSRGK